MDERDVRKRQQEAGADGKSDASMTGEAPLPDAATEPDIPKAASSSCTSSVPAPETNTEPALMPDPPPRLPYPPAVSAALPALPTVLTADELAALLRINRKTVYAGFRAGDIPGGRRIGGTIRFSRDAVLRWLAEGQVSRSSRGMR